MSKRKLTITGETVEYAIRDGLRQIGLPQTKTIIKVLQKESQGFFGDREAAISILYDEKESDVAIKERTYEEFSGRIILRFEEGKAKIRVPAAFYDDTCFISNDARKEFLAEFLEKNDIHEYDEEFIDRVCGDVQSQHHFVTVKTFSTTSLNEEGSSILFELAEDAMLCRAIIFHKEEVSEEQVLDALKEKGYIKGVLRHTLQEVLKNKTQGFFTIAVGKSPINDQRGIVERFFQEDEHKQFAGMMQTLTIDTRTVKDINVVSRNELLMTIGEVIDGHDGYTVDGQLLLREQLGDEPPVTLGQNVYLSDNEKEVYAKTAGHIVWKTEERFIDIEPIYTVEGNVDFSEGNITGFVGKVVIKGDVRPRFSVVAEGDIEVHGSVEDAVVESTKGNVLVKGTVVHQNEGYVQASETVFVSIATNATLRGKKIMIDKECMNSQLQATEEIHISGAPGVLVGGIATAKYLIKANTIGSESWVSTKIHVGDVTELNKYLKDVRSRLITQKAQLEEGKEAIALLSKRAESNPLSESQEQQLASMQEQIPLLTEDIKYDEEEEKKIIKEIKDQTEAKLEVSKTLYPHVDLNIFEGYFLPTEEENNTGFRCKEGLVVSYPL